MGFHVHFDVLLFVLLIGILYVEALVRLQPQPRWLHPVEKRHPVLFFSGLVVIFIAEGTQLHELSEQYLFSAHMIQHLLITMVAPPLMMLGTPGWVLQPLLARPRVLPVVRLLTKPIVAIVLFNGALALWHVPALYDAALADHNLHILNHALYAVSALLMWWPVANTLPETPRLSYGVQMLYLFIQSLVPAILASMITFSDTVVYTPYALAPRIWDISPLEDQQIGGVAMKMLMGVELWGIAIAIFFTWFRHEEAEPEKSWD